MKPRRFFLSLLPVILLSLTGCVEMEDGGPVESQGYQLGFEKGREDGQGGKSRTPDRHSSLYSEADRGEFFRGYEDGYTLGIKPGADLGGVNAPVAFGQPLVAMPGKGEVTIKEGNQTISVLKTALPNIEETKFIVEQEQIVVKSRGNHGPAMVELFQTSNGAALGAVKAFEIKNGQPAWAAGMGD